MGDTDRFAETPFAYRDTKQGDVHISCRGKTVTTLRGDDAVRFLAKVTAMDEPARQLLMAKVTGHFKHGNEKVAKRKRRR